MKRRIMFHLAVVVLWWMTAHVPPVEAFNSGSTGADGAFNPTASMELQVPAGSVLHFTTVTIPAGVLVTVKPNAANTPLTILASGAVTIDGVLSVNGQSAQGAAPGAGGSGGFRGGTGNGTTGFGGTGLGPGGGLGGTPTRIVAGGSFATLGGGGAGLYGTTFLLPLIGGSGGGGEGAATTVAPGGGAGGGAVLIASSGTITLNGNVTADGGTGGVIYVCTSRVVGAGGSGGAIRLVATKIQGGGSTTARGGSGGTGTVSTSGGLCYLGTGPSGGSGRIRLEAEICCGSISSTPPASIGLPLPVSLSSVPTLKIQKVGGITAPDPPGGNAGTLDIALPVQSGPTAIELAASGVPLGTTATVKVVPEAGSDPVSVTSSPLSGTVASSTATASATLPTGVSFITATVTIVASTTTASLPAFAGDPVAVVRLETQFGGATTTTYVLASGREVSLQ